MEDMEFLIESKRRKSTAEAHHHRPGSSLESLPQEIALDIISRLDIKSLIQFRFVSRIWHKFSHDQELANLHLTRSLDDNNNNRALIFHCDFPMNNLLYFVEFSDEDHEKCVIRRFKTPFSRILPEFRIVGSCGGLLCLSNSLIGDGDGPCVYNPFTQDYKFLPKSIEYHDQEVVLGFGVHPTTNEYCVVRIVYYWNLYDLQLRRSHMFRLRNFPKSEVRVFYQGSERWRVVVGDIPYKLDMSSGGVFVNGRLHWLSMGKNRPRRERILLSFCLSDEMFREVPLPENHVNRVTRRYSLSVLGGYLSAIDPSRTSFGAHDIWMMKEYGVKESWEKIFSIGVYDVTRIQSPDMQKMYRIWKNVLNERYLRVLCLLRNGEILLQYKWGALVSYNPECGVFKDLTFEGIPKFFHTVVHIGSLSRAN